FTSVGWDVELLGVMPTPTVAWLVPHRNLPMGVMISASHNPAQDNGIKFFGPKGTKLDDATEARIEEVMLAKSWHRPSGTAVGRISRHQRDAWEPYIDFLLATDLPEFRPMKLAVDLANGAMFELAPAVFTCLELNVSYLYRHPDGQNINANCGSTNLEPLKHFVREHEFDLGLAFDGDGDRCLAVGPDGQEIDGDRMMYLCSRYLPHLKDEKAVVATVMSNLGLEQALAGCGRELIRTAVGDRYVLEAMQAGGNLLGGEQSGHLIFAKYQITGDGLLTALQLLHAIQRSGKPLSELLTEVPQYPQLLKNVVVKPQWQRGWVEHEGLQAAISAAEVELAGSGRLLVRASGTEPKLRVMAEGKDMDQVQNVVDRLVKLIKTEMGT
ncbi:MAG: phosphoglucosamine mutase, partial [Candidatus Sericytochromatia bacterium]